MALISENDEGFETFFGVCRQVLDRFTLRKRKYIRQNNTPFMNTNLSREIMNRSKLIYKFFETRSDEDRKRYTKQRNLCISPLKKAIVELVLEPQ